jgi:hypothetical protein
MAVTNQCPRASAVARLRAFVWMVYLLKKCGGSCAGVKAGFRENARLPLGWRVNWAMGDFEGKHQMPAEIGCVSITFLTKARCGLHGEIRERCIAFILAAGPPIVGRGGGSREMLGLRGLGEGVNTS